MATAIEFEHVSKQYRLGLVSTKTLSHDIRRFWITNVLGKEDPYLKKAAWGFFFFVRGGAICPLPWTGDNLSPIAELSSVVRRRDKSSRFEWFFPKWKQPFQLPRNPRLLSMSEFSTNSFRMNFTTLLTPFYVDALNLL